MVIFKYYYSKDLIIQGIIELRPCPTALMIADILTKDLAVREFKDMSVRLRNVGEFVRHLTDEVYTKLYAYSTDQVHIGNYYDEYDIKMINIIRAIVRYF